MYVSVYMISFNLDFKHIFCVILIMCKLLIRTPGVKSNFDIALIFNMKTRESCVISNKDWIINGFVRGSYAALLESNEFY